MSRIVIVILIYHRHKPTDFSVSSSAFRHSPPYVLHRLVLVLCISSHFLLHLLFVTRAIGQGAQA
jgi:hypothetical protein